MDIETLYEADGKFYETEMDAEENASGPVKEVTVLSIRGKYFLLNEVSVEGSAYLL